MHAVTFTKQLAAASANNISLSQSLAGAGKLLLNGSTAGVLDTQRRVLITSAGNDSGLTWTITGTNDGGAAIKDSVAGGNIAAVASNLDFASVTSIASSGATAAAVTVGTNTVGSSPWAIYDDTIVGSQMSVYVQLISGSGNVSIEYTYTPFLGGPGIQSAIAYAPPNIVPTPVLHPQLQNLAATTEGAIDFTIHAWRLTVNSGTGQWKAYGRQAGLASP
ncbi:MAG TPA: hypothetical protein VGG45_16195 [Terracidiphilus sp.]|jgi:hypothetical protein